MGPPAPTTGAVGPTADCSAQSAAYLSPALARGEVEDTRRDIYACGAILYHMLTGRPPYRGETPAAVLEQIRAGPPPPILELNPAADRALARVAQRAMARNLHDRYRDMGEMLADLDRIGRTWMAGLFVTRRGQLRVAAAGAVALASLLLGLAAWLRSQPRPAGTYQELISPVFSTSYGQPIVFPELAPVPNMAVDVTIPPGGCDVEVAIVAADGATSDFSLDKLTGWDTRKGAVEFAIERVDRNGDVGQTISHPPIGPVEMATKILLPLRFATDRDVPPGEYRYQLLARTSFGSVAAAHVQLSVTLVDATY